MCCVNFLLLDYWRLGLGTVMDTYFLNRGSRYYLEYLIQDFNIRIIEFGWGLRLGRTREVETCTVRKEEVGTNFFQTLPGLTRLTDIKKLNTTRHKWESTYVPVSITIYAININIQLECLVYLMNSFSRTDIKLSIISGYRFIFAVQTPKLLQFVLPHQSRIVTLCLWGHLWNKVYLLTEIKKLLSSMKKLYLITDCPKNPHPIIFLLM